MPQKLLARLNIVLIISIAILGVYLIHHNYIAYSLHYKTIKLREAFNINSKINAQLHLKVTHHKSNLHIKEISTKELNMQLPKRIHTLD